MNESIFAIRPLVNEDRARWEPLWLGYQTFYKVQLGAAVTDLFTEPDLRGKGVGRALIEAVYREAAKAGGVIVGLCDTAQGERTGNPDGH